MFTTYLILFLFGYVKAMNEGDSCISDSDKSEGVCVPADQCLKARQDFESRRIPPTICSFSRNVLILCCADNKTSITSKLERVSKRKCKEYTPVRKIDYIPLVPGGEDALLYEFPHMAAIGWKSNDGYSFDCGGSLISEKYVLTAAHCTTNRFKESPAVVVLGEKNIDPKVEDGAQPLIIPIRRIVKHPDYKAPIVYDDIALIELYHTVVFSEHTRPACLWLEDDFGVHKEAQATGWGVIDTRTGEKAKELQKAYLPLYDNDYCDTLLSSLRNRHWKDGFRTSQMCAGDLNGVKDTCQGDSGGPLQLSRDGCGLSYCYYIIGVTSFGKGCAEAGRVAVYTRVSSYVDWIERTVWPTG